MSATNKIADICIKLTSIDTQTRKKAIAELKVLAAQIQNENLIRISSALFYFYQFSESGPSQHKDREELFGFFDWIPNTLRMPARQVFLEAMVKLWNKDDNESIDKFLVLLKEFYFKVYREFDSETKYKPDMVAWNDFLSTCIIFNPRELKRSKRSCFGASFCPSKS